MKDFDEFIGTMLAVIAEQGNDETGAALAVRKLTREALAGKTFLIGCAERVIESMESARGEWRNPPLFRRETPRLSVQVFYWPPGKQNDPHLHTSWTVTGVLHNEIKVETFETVPSSMQPAQAQPSKTIVGRAGDTGYLLPPCVHRLHNVSSTANAATLHIFSGEDQLEKPSPGQRVLRPRVMGSADRRRLFAVWVITELLARSDHPSAAALLQRAFAFGDSHVKLHVVKALLPHDVKLACNLSRQLEAGLAGADRERLARINSALSVA